MKGLLLFTDLTNYFLTGGYRFDVTDQVKNEHVKAHVQKLIRKFLANLYA